jgi:hypothetical protein
MPMSRRFTTRAAVAALALVTASAVAVDPAGGRAGPVPGPPTVGAGTCDPIDAGGCLLPFPNDRFTVPADTPTGLRVELPPEGMPANAGGTRIDPTAWNRNDGFSPGSMVLADVPGLDLQVTFGLPPGTQVLDRPAVSLAPDAPIVLLDLDSGERVPYLAEIDTHPDAVAAGEQLLIVRPLEHLRSGHRHAVALRSLRQADGSVIEPDPVFRWYRDGGRPPDAVEPARSTEMQQLFRELRRAGVAQDDLYLAWSFTVASDEGVTGRALHVRDGAFAELGDVDLGDGVVDGQPPGFTVTSVSTQPDAATVRRVQGSVLVPNYLHTAEPPPIGSDGGVNLTSLLAGTTARFAYATPTPGVADQPLRNTAAPLLSVPYVCNIPTVATAGDPATPMLYGHGLLGSRTQANGFSTVLLRERNFAPCGVDFAGMSSADLALVVSILQDLSGFETMVDRLQQGFVNFLFVGRALSHPEGFAAHPAFQDGSGDPLIDVDGLSYTGISQGGILGGAVVALSPDLTNGVLGVPGVNYSTLLNRSVDWEGAQVGNLFYASYPGPKERQIAFALIQMLWTGGKATATPVAPPTTRCRTRRRTTSCCTSRSRTTRSRTSQPRSTPDRSVPACSRRRSRPDVTGRTIRRSG